MKNMLLTAAAVGAVLAAMIVYVKRKNRASFSLTGSAMADEENETADTGALNRPAYHAMG